MVVSKKFFLITGGSSGIGKQMAADLLQKGNKVVIVANDKIILHEAFSELKKISSEVFFYPADINNSCDVSAMAQRVIHEHGAPDVLVNCAGFATYRTFEETDLAEIERLVGVNLLGAMRCAHYFLPSMIDRRSGMIVNVASIAGKLLITPNAVYGACKHGVVAWSEALRYELARFNIKISVICPGRIETAFFDHETFRKRIPRTETQLTVPIEKASKAIIRAIEKEKFLTFIPSGYRLLVWLVNTFSFFLKPVYGKLLYGRIDDLYRRKDSGS